MAVLRALVFLAIFPASQAMDVPSTRLIGYFDAKSQKELSLESVPANLTDVVLTSAVKVDNQGNLHFYAAQPGDLDGEELIVRLSKLPLRLIVSLRGHDDDVALDELAEVDDARSRFAEHMATSLQGWGASGVEIEWHSDDPAGGKAATEPFDQMEQYHFALLCRDLAKALRSSGGNKTLSVAVRPGRQEFREASFVNKYVDWLALRAYSMRSLGDPHHSSFKDMVSALAEWEDKGVEKSKLVVSTALFGRPGASLHSAGDRNEALRRSWKELAAGSHHVAPRGDKRGDIVVDASTGKAWWVSGVNTTRSKAKHIVDNGYGGLALRDLHQDAAGELSLREAAAEVIRKHGSILRRFLAKPLNLLQKSLHRSRAGPEEQGREL